MLLDAVDAPVVALARRVPQPRALGRAVEHVDAQHLRVRGLDLGERRAAVLVDEHRVDDVAELLVLDAELVELLGRGRGRERERERATRDDVIHIIARGYIYIAGW